MQIMYSSSDRKEGQEGIAFLRAYRTCNTQWSGFAVQRPPGTEQDCCSWSKWRMPGDRRSSVGCSRCRRSSSGCRCPGQGQGPAPMPPDDVHKLLHPSPHSGKQSSTTGPKRSRTIPRDNCPVQFSHQSHNQQMKCNIITLPCKPATNQDIGMQQLPQRHKIVKGHYFNLNLDLKQKRVEGYRWFPFISSMSQI
jgi:hypothetical protein